MATAPVNLENIKGRIAEALVESIFRRAEYKMTRFEFRGRNINVFASNGGNRRLSFS